MADEKARGGHVFFFVLHFLNLYRRKRKKERKKREKIQVRGNVHLNTFLLSNINIYKA